MPGEIRGPVSAQLALVWVVIVFGVLLVLGTREEEAIALPYPYGGLAVLSRPLGSQMLYRIIFHTVWVVHGFGLPAILSMEGHQSVRRHPRRLRWAG